MFRRLRPTTASTGLAPDRPPRRSTWAAIGAAIAVSIGGIAPGLIDRVSATRSTGDRAIYVPITPCRLLDTRPQFNIGLPPGAVGPSSTTTFQVRGNTAPCPASISSDATALSLNVTAIDQTAPTFLTFWGDGARPNTSNLNPVPGQPPTPNAVDVPLGAAGEFQFFNLAGDVHVIVDAVGFYEHHDHDDRYVTDVAFVAAMNSLSSSVWAPDFMPLAAPPCRADETAAGESRDGVWDTCLTFLASMSGEFRGTVTFDLGWHAIGPGPSFGECRLRDGNGLIVGEARDMGQSTDTTQADGPGTTTIVWAVNGLGTTVYSLECRERLGDIDWEHIDGVLSTFRPLAP